MIYILYIGKLLENFDTIYDIVSVWMLLFTEILDKHAPIKSYRIERQYQPVESMV